MGDVEARVGGDLLYFVGHFFYRPDAVVQEEDLALAVEFAVDGFFDLFTVLFLTRYRQKPLHLFGFLGMTSLCAGVVISLYLTLLWLQGYGIGSRPLLFLGILLIIVGMQSFSIGLIGEMITNLKDEEVSYPIKEKIF